MYIKTNKNQKGQNNSMFAIEMWEWNEIYIEKSQTKTNTKI